MSYPLRHGHLIKVLTFLFFWKNQDPLLVKNKNTLILFFKKQLNFIKKSLNQHNSAKQTPDVNNKFHHSQKSQFSEESFLNHINKAPNFNGSLGEKQPKIKKTNSNSSNVGMSAQKTPKSSSTGESMMKSHASSNNSSNNHNMKAHVSSVPSPSLLSNSSNNNSDPKLASHSPSLANFSPAGSMPSRPSSINQMQISSSPLPHSNTNPNNSHLLEQQQQQFLMAQQLLLRNPQMLNEQSNSNLKQQYQNMLNNAQSNPSKFFPNDMSPANHMRGGTPQAQHHPPPHIQPPNLFMSPQQLAAAQSEEINRLGLIERERQIRMFTQMMSAAGAPGMNEDIYR